LKVNGAAPRLVGHGSAQWRHRAMVSVQGPRYGAARCRCHSKYPVPARDRSSRARVRGSDGGRNWCDIAFPSWRTFLPVQSSITAKHQGSVRISVNEPSQCEKCLP
jgi:hypothetical protein